MRKILTASLKQTRPSIPVRLAIDGSNTRVVRSKTNFQRLRKQMDDSMPCRHLQREDHHPGGEPTLRVWEHAVEGQHKRSCCWTAGSFDPYVGAVTSAGTLNPIKTINPINPTDPINKINPINPANSN